jgi:hypothetical protein
MNKDWMIISWRHNDHMDGAYGQLMEEFNGTYEEVTDRARRYVPDYSPVGVVGVIS